MKIRRLILSAMAVVGLVLPLSALAQDIQVLPEPDDQCLPYGYDYGDVLVGDTSTMLMSVTNTNGAELDVIFFEILDDPDGNFSILSMNPPAAIPGAIQSGESVDVEVGFSPSAPGTSTATIFIRSDATNTTPCGEPLFYLEYNLQGTGVGYEPPPGELMATLIGFVEEGVEAGTIVGVGPGNSAGGRLRAFGNMLDSADDLIADGDIAAACTQLGDLANRADGAEPPPDFIGGEGAPAVYTMILEVMSALGCEITVM